MLQDFKNQLSAHILVEHNVIRFSKLQVVIPTSCNYFLFEHVKKSTDSLDHLKNEIKN